MPAISAGVPDAPDALEEWVTTVRELGIGNFTLRVRTAEGAFHVIQALQDASEIPLFINVNFEFGTGTFWSEGTVFPRQMALAATGDADTARRVGELTARECRACGVHWISVPICDVNINPENPIINIRSYGEDVDTVRAFVTAFTEGCEGGGVMACAKHFPGHGDTAMDSHLELAVVDSDRARLEAVEFPPFQAAVDAGVSTVMTSHIWFPALMGEEGEIPATVSENVLTDLLRNDMGFTGLVLTDAMSMRGVTSRMEPGPAAVATIAAGADVILDSPDDRAAHAALVAAVNEGSLPEARFNESVMRVLRAKARAGLHHGVSLDPEAALASLRRPDAVEAARDMAQRAITVVRDKQGTLPVDTAEVKSALSIALYDEWARWESDTLNALNEGMRARFENVQSEVVLREPKRALAQRLLDADDTVSDDEIARRWTLPQERRDALLETARGADITVVSAFVRTASYKGSIDLGEDQMALIEELTASGRPVILAVFGSPYILTAMPDVPCQILTYDTSALFAEVLPGAIVGEFPIQGRLPVTLPGLAARGDGLQIPARNPAGTP
jgi:beta-N-acetylhexosaminidase